MQKKSAFLQVFRVAIFVFLIGGLQNQPVYAGSAADLIQGEMKDFVLHAEPKPLPDVDFLDVTSRPIKLSDFRGRLVLLTLWATWCPYCSIEMPMLSDMQEEFGRDKFMVLPISVDKEGPRVVKKYLEEKSINLPTYSDPKMRLGISLRASGVPYAILIDQQGREIGRIPGETNWKAPEAAALIKAFIK
ncbi:MAG: TlpA disulfide reductase family protein [Alphaproteobacteria bacterium]|nr:TlpA disulfide reductase family protein [Alphaproteobacteria bacterium]